MATEMDRVTIKFVGRSEVMRNLREVWEQWDEVFRRNAKLVEMFEEVHRLKVKLVHTQYRQRRGRRW